MNLPLLDKVVVDVLGAVYIYLGSTWLCACYRNLYVCVCSYTIIHAEYSYSYADIPQLLGQLIPVTFGHQTSLKLDAEKELHGLGDACLPTTIIPRIYEVETGHWEQDRIRK